MIVVAAGSLFYLYEFFLRVAPGAMAQELMGAFNIDAGSLGLLAAWFFYGYAPMQIPAGLLGDRFGPRRVLLAAIAICAIATFLFATTESFIMASSSRLFIGVAASFAYIGPLMLASRWLHAKHFAMATGSIQLIGSFGAIIGGEPVARVVSAFGWRQSMIYAAMIGIGIAIIIGLVVKDNPKGEASPKCNTAKEKHPELKRLRTVCGNPQTWWTGLIGFCFWAPMSVFAELWGIPFLMRTYHVSAIDASSATMWIWIGVIFGGPINGWWTNHVHSRRKPIMITLLINLAAAFGMIYWHPHSWQLLEVLLFVFGFTCAAQCITFGLVSDNNPTNVAGTAVGFNNMAVIAGGSLLQPLVGLILRSFWDGSMNAGGIPIYSAHSYNLAFMMIPACTLIGLLTVMFKIKETHCLPQFETDD